MKFSQDDLEMKLFGINFGKKEKSVVDIQGNPISSEDGLSRRDFLKGSVGAIAGTVLKNSGIGVAANFLMNGEAHANQETGWLRLAFGALNQTPPLFTSKLYSGEKIQGDTNLLQLGYLYIMGGGTDHNAMITLLTGQDRRNVNMLTIPKDVVYCETGAHSIAMSTFLWKLGSIGLEKKEYQYMEKHFYHNYALDCGITDFYEEHVYNGSVEWGTEKMLVESLFSCAEVYPQRGKIKAEKYLKSNFNERVDMIQDLSKEFSNMSLGNVEKLRQDRDISGTTGKGPLNNWYRLVSAQTSAFFLTCHYDKLKEERFANSIYNNIEKGIRKKISKIRGPPHYQGF